MIPLSIPEWIQDDLLYMYLYFVQEKKTFFLYSLKYKLFIFGNFYKKIFENILIKINYLLQQLFIAIKNILCQKIKNGILFWLPAAYFLVQKK